MNIKIKVNGNDYEKEVDPATRLLDFLRDDLGLKGTKFGNASNLVRAALKGQK